MKSTIKKQVAEALLSTRRAVRGIENGTLGIEEAKQIIRGNAQAITADSNAMSHRRVRLDAKQTGIALSEIEVDDNIEDDVPETPAHAVRRAG